MTNFDLDRQVIALKHHHSQSRRTYTSREWLAARAVFRGQQVGLHFAQAYRIVRSVIISP
jgi:hypothetical protein